MTSVIPPFPPREHQQNQGKEKGDKKGQVVVRRWLRATAHNQLETTIVRFVEIGYYRQWRVKHQGEGKPPTKCSQLSHDGQE